MSDFVRSGHAEAGRRLPSREDKKSPVSIYTETAAQHTVVKLTGICSGGRQLQLWWKGGVDLTCLESTWTSATPVACDESSDRLRRAGAGHRSPHAARACMVLPSVFQVHVLDLWLVPSDESRPAPRRASSTTFHCRRGSLRGLASAWWHARHLPTRLQAHSAAQWQHLCGT